MSTKDTRSNEEAKRQTERPANDINIIRTRTHTAQRMRERKNNESKQ